MRQPSPKNERRMRMMRSVELCTFLLILLTVWTQTSEALPLPPPPLRHVTDAARALPENVVTQLDARLQQFERETSNQVLIAVFSSRPQELPLADYTQRVVDSWKVGQKDKDNGAVLFVFLESREVYIQVGYGLEGALPDARCKKIIEEEIVPRFRQRDFAGGLEAAVGAIMAATQGEYQGTAQTQGSGATQSKINPVIPIFLLLILIFIVTRITRSGPVVYSSGGGSWRSGGGGWSSGGSRSGGSGGGFSGGGGSFGGGGAGGRW